MTEWDIWVARFPELSALIDDVPEETDDRKNGMSHMNHVLFEFLMNDADRQILSRYSKQTTIGRLVRGNRRMPFMTLQQQPMIDARPCEPKSLRRRFMDWMGRADK